MVGPDYLIRCLFNPNSYQTPYTVLLVLSGALYDVPNREFWGLGFVVLGFWSWGFGGWGLGLGQIRFGLTRFCPTLLSQPSSTQSNLVGPVWSGRFGLTQFVRSSFIWPGSVGPSSLNRNQIVQFPGPNRLQTPSPARFDLSPISWEEAVSPIILKRLKTAGSPL